MNKKEYKLLSPKLDVVFQKLFGEEGCEEITKSLLQAIIGKKIEHIDLSQNPILRRDYLKGKLGILDVVARINGKESVVIELQVAKRGQERERILYYWGRKYIKGIEKGKDYIDLKKTIVIMITDFEIEGLEELDLHSRWHVKDESGMHILTKKLEIHIIELPKIKEKSNIDEELLDWLIFIENPNSERVKKKMRENKALKEAKSKLDKMSEDEKMQKIAEWREKAILEEKAMYRYAMTHGVEEGRKRGIEQSKIEIAKKLLSQNVNLEIIEKATGLQKEEIERLKSA